MRHQTSDNNKTVTMPISEYRKMEESYEDSLRYKDQCDQQLEDMYQYLIDNIEIVHFNMNYEQNHHSDCYHKNRLKNFKELNEMPKDQNEVKDKIIKDIYKFSKKYNLLEVENTHLKFHIENLEQDVESLIESKDTVSLAEEGKEYITLTNCDDEELNKSSKCLTYLFAFIIMSLISWLAFWR